MALHDAWSVLKAGRFRQRSRKHNKRADREFHGQVKRFLADRDKADEQYLDHIDRAFYPLGDGTRTRGEPPRQIAGLCDSGNRLVDHTKQPKWSAWRDFMPHFCMEDQCSSLHCQQKRNAALEAGWKPPLDGKGNVWLQEPLKRHQIEDWHSKFPNPLGGERSEQNDP